jgi:hypothetical protein
MLADTQGPLGAQATASCCIVGLQGMALGELRCCRQVIRHERHDSIALRELAREATIGALPLCPPDPASALDGGSQRQPPCV